MKVPREQSEKISKERSITALSIILDTNTSHCREVTRSWGMLGRQHEFKETDCKMIPVVISEELNMELKKLNK